jgi:hypothetical protein
MKKLLALFVFASLPLFASPKVLMDQEIQVLRGDIKQFHFLVPESRAPLKFKGNFKTSGGFNDDINLYVFTQENYVRWYSKYPHKNELRMMKKTEGKFETSAKPGETYYFVFENFFSTISNKKIRFKLELVPAKE